MKKLITHGNTPGKTHKHNYVFAFSQNRLSWKFCNLCGQVRPNDVGKYERSCKRKKLNDWAVNVFDEI